MLTGAAAAAGGVMHPYGPVGRAVLHVDADAFFCQVEVLCHPSLRGLPLAIQQDQDVIAVNYPARLMGVRKHMAVEEAREVLVKGGGVLHHAFTTDDGRVTYRPYREASGALMRLLQQGLPQHIAAAVLVVERASIDEAFMLIDTTAAAAAAARPAAAASATANAAAAALTKALPPPQQQQQQQMVPGLDIPLSDMAVWVQQAGSLSWDLSAAVAEGVRAAVVSQLGLTVSVGVAPNRLLAKLASRAAKPDGVHVVDSVAAVQRLLGSNGVDRLPGLGGAVAAALRGGGIEWISQLQACSAPSCQPCVAGVQPHTACCQAVGAGVGRDTAPVVAKGPAKSIQVQMTLTSHRMQAIAGAMQQQQQQQSGTAAAAAGPPSAAAATSSNPTGSSVTGSSSGSNGGSSAAAGPVRKPLLTGYADSVTRVSAVLRAMSGDLLGRVMMDRHTEGRWPTKLSLTLTLVPDHTAAAAAAAAAAATAAAKPSTFRASRSTNFPPPPAQTTASTSAAEADAAAAPTTTAAAAGTAPSAAAAAAAAAAVFAAPGVVGEKAFAVAPQLQGAVLEVAVGLAQSLMSSLPCRHVVLQVNLAATHFMPVEACKPQGGDIRTHFTAAAQQTKPTAAATAAAAAAARNPQQQQRQGGAATVAAVPRSRQHPAGASTSAASAAAAAAQQSAVDSRRQVPAAAAAAVAAGRTRDRDDSSGFAREGSGAGPVNDGMQQQHFRQPQQQHTPQATGNLQQQQQQQQFVFAEQHPPVRLSQQLLALCDPPVSAAAAAADLQRLLAESAAGAAAGGGSDGDGDIVRTYIL